MVMLVALSRVKAVLQGQRMQGVGIIPSRPSADPICALLGIRAFRMSYGCAQGDVWDAAPPCTGGGLSVEVEMVLCFLRAMDALFEAERSSCGQALMGVTVHPLNTLHPW